MTPTVAHVLRCFAASLLTEIAPRLEQQYTGGSLTLMGLMLLMSAEEHERAADLRAQENRELRALFAEAAPAVGDASLARALAAAASTADASLRIADLDRANDELQHLLIRLHEHVESHTTPTARTLERRIWDWLDTATRRRHIDLPL